MKSRTQACRTSRIVFATTAITLAMVLTACGSSVSANKVEDVGGTAPVTLSQSEWDELVSKAKEEGSLTVFASAAGSDVHLLEFQKEYPEIAVTVERQSTANLITRLEQEMSVSSPSADVVFTTQTRWYEEKGEQKMLAPLRLGPEASDGYANVKDLGRYYAPVLRNPSVVGYNTNLGKKVTAIEEALTDSHGKKIGIVEPAASAAYGHQWMTWDENVPDFMDLLSEVDARQSLSGVPLSQALAAGELAYVFPLTPGILKPLIDQGAPVGEVVLGSATGVQYDVGATAASRHPNAAQLFMNWMMSEKGQNFMLDNFGPGAIVSGQGNSMQWDDIVPFEGSGRTQEEIDNWIAGTWKPVMAN